MSGRHESVLLARTIEFVRAGAGLYLDATLGDGGHSEALLDAEPESRVLGTDRDPKALAVASDRLRRFGARVMIEHATFLTLPEAHRRHGAIPLRGAILDLGLSSRQIDDPDRGMSFMSEGPLDLRMDETAGAPAFERLASIEVDELATILRDYGDVPFAGRLARGIVAAARAGELPTTRSLVTLVERVLGRAQQPRRLAQIFQALRMWINGEADELEGALAWLPQVMSPGGIVVTIAYHSGEDRRIKRALRGVRDVFPSRRRPTVAEERLDPGPWETLTPKVVTPEEAELSSNPRSRSARLRAFRRRAA